MGCLMTKRSGLLIAAVAVATGAALIGRSWVAGDQSGSATRPVTTESAAETMTPAEAARIAERMIEGWRRSAAISPVPVFHCKLATARQRELCAHARPLTPAAVAAELLARTRAPQGGTRCVVQTENGDLWTLEANPAARCLNL